jgi:hypothetical protein
MGVVSPSCFSLSGEYSSHLSGLQSSASAPYKDLSRPKTHMLIPTVVYKGLVIMFVPKQKRY